MRFTTLSRGSTRCGLDLLLTRCATPSMKRKPALIALLRKTVGYARYPLAPPPRPAQGRPSEVGAASAEARAVATIEAWNGAEPRAREAGMERLALIALCLALFLSA
jgi:hypothetical protein